MFRTRFQSMSIEQEFVRQGVPYQLVAGTKFYEKREVLAWALGG